MSDVEEVAERKYLWAIEWNNPFTREHSRGITFYNLAPLSGVKEEEFEKFIKDEGFPAVGGILTRAIQFGPQYLLKERGDEGPDPLDNHQAAEMVKKLESLSTHKLDKQFYVVLSSEPTSSE